MNDMNTMNKMNTKTTYWGSPESGGSRSARPADLSLRNRHRGIVVRYVITIAL